VTTAPSRCAAVVTFAALLAATAVHAGGPLVVATDGGAVGWNTSAPIPYRVDRGGLGVLSNADAAALVGSLFGRWAGVPTATISFAPAGTLAVDVDASNFGPFLGPYGGAVALRHENAIVFDADGSIFDTLFGVGTGVVGFAGPAFMSNGTVTVPIGDSAPPGAKIVEGLAFLNGKWIDGRTDTAHGNFEMTLPRFDAVVVHELGHFAGLDHTQIHGLYGPPESDSAVFTTPIETMFPFNVDETQATPGRDDVVALSTLYPTAGFLASTGRIAGRVLDAFGHPFSGANVIARNVDDDTDAVSYVSGATIVHPGAFVLGGLLPGARYTVEVQPIDAFHTGGSQVGPFSSPVLVPGPPEFYNGDAESADPAVDDPSAQSPITAGAGVTTTGVDVVLNRQPFAISNVYLEAGSQPNSFAVGDFDRDGTPDFVATQFGFDPGNVVRLFRGLGNGTFATPVTIASFPGNAYVVAGQFNAGTDTFLDIAVASTTLQEVRVYFGDGRGHFGLPQTLVAAPSAGAVLRGLAVGDLDGDSHADLVTLVERADGSATAYALLGSATGSFTPVTTAMAVGSGFPRGAFHLGQVMGSAAVDVVGIGATGGAAFGPAAIGVLIGDGRGRFTPATIPLAAITGGIGLSALAVGDFDENGTLDLALPDTRPVGGPINWTRSFVDLLLGDGAGRFTLASRYEIPETSQDDIAAADFDGDSHLDFASAGAWFGPGSPGAKVNVAYGDGAGGIRHVTSVWGLAEFPTQLVAADLDGDGHVDLLVNDGQSAGFGLPPEPAYSVLLQQDTACCRSTTTTTSTTSTTLVVSFAANADTWVDAGSPKSKFGTKTTMSADATPIRIAYVRFTVASVGSRPVVQAILRLTVDSGSSAQSASGGSLHRISDTTWQEKSVTYRARPVMDGPVVATAGTVRARQVVDFDVTSVVPGDGTYTFAIDSASGNGVRYVTREAPRGSPRLLLGVR
jgi:hypothetical protein